MHEFEFQLVLGELLETDASGLKYILSKNLPLLLRNLENELNIKIDRDFHQTTHSFVSKFPNLFIYDDLLLKFLNDLYHVNFLRYIESKRSVEVDIKKILLSPFKLSPLTSPQKPTVTVVKSNSKPEKSTNPLILINLILIFIILLIFAFSLFKNKIIEALLNESGDLYWWQTIKPLEEWIWWLVDEYSTKY